MVPYQNAVFHATVIFMLLISTIILLPSGGYYFLEIRKLQVPLYLVAQPLPPPPFYCILHDLILLIWIVFHIGWQSQHN